MQILTAHMGREAEIVDLFTTTFTASEGEAEGALIGGLARELLGSTTERDLFVFSAEQDGRIIGSIFFTRLSYAQDGRTLFLLAPVAVTTDRQGEGIGQALLRYGLAALRSAGVEIVMTYGDPNYYAKVGFMQISELDAPAPFPLEHPQGWLIQPLIDRPMAPLKGAPRCVEALNNPVFW